MNHMTNGMVFFGTPRFAVTILDQLAEAGIMPALVVTAPDKPQGRGLVLTPPPVKVWAEAKGIPCIQPESLRTDDAQKDILMNSEWDLFVVAAYGKILPKEILDLPAQGTLNVHPSLLPRFRGASPIESQILADEKEVGVSIMLMDEEMDHGAVLSAVRITPDPWPPKARELEDVLAHEGGALLAETIPLWLDGALPPEEQDHTKATFTKKIEKADGLVDLRADGYQNYLKFCAYDEWPGTYFFEDNVRMKIVDSVYVDGEFRPTRVIPENKKERDYLPPLK